MSNSLPIKIGQAASRTVHPVLGDINGAIDGIKVFRSKATQLSWTRTIMHGSIAFVILLAFSVSLSQPAGRSNRDSNWPLRPGRGKPPAQRTDLGTTASNQPTPPTSSAAVPANSSLQPTAKDTKNTKPLLGIPGTSITIDPPVNLPQILPDQNPLLP